MNKEVFDLINDEIINMITEMVLALEGKDKVDVLLFNSLESNLILRFLTVIAEEKGITVQYLNKEVNAKEIDKSMISDTLFVVGSFEDEVDEICNNLSVDKEVIALGIKPKRKTMKN